MSEVNTSLPQVRVDDPQLQKLLDQLVLTLRTWNGETRNELDQVITYRDLIQDTTIATRFNQALYDGAIPGGLNTSGGDLTVPAQLNSLVVGQGATKNVLSWAGTGGSNYSYTEIWRNTTDDLGNAELNGTTEAEVFADEVGDIAQEYFYWVRAVSTGGTPGPFNDTTGTAQTISAVDTAHIANAAIVEAKIGSLAVTNAKIGLLAVDTAQIAAAAITNAKIDNLAVDTAQIASAAITNAKIDDLAVDTLQLANQAVTIPVSSYTAGSTVLAVGVGDKVAQTATITSTGAPVMITGRFDLSIYVPTAQTTTFRFMVWRGSTDIYVGRSKTINGGGSGVTEDIADTLAMSHTPTSGSTTYNIGIEVISLGGGVTFTAQARSLVLLETKK